MKRINTSNYNTDKLYPRVARAVAEILRTADFVAPVEVMMRMQCIDDELYEDWRIGRISYLERVFVGSLGKANRILRILRMHAHDLNLIPSPTVYRKWGRGKKGIVLRFSKSGDPNLEAAYSQHFVVTGERRKVRSDALPATPAEQH